ncbi:MAG: Fur family transcriptional regulator [Anaerolineae bacterium]
MLVLQVLEDAGEHLDAETIWMRSRDYDPDVSLATVYRTLAKLKEVDLVSQRFYDRDHKREVYAVNQEERFFFTCRNCKQVIQLRTPLIAQARRQWERELGLVISQGCMCFDGYCSDCAQVMAAQNGHNGHNGQSAG